MGEIKRYHSDTPDWRKTTHAKSGALIGIELEVNNKKGKHVAADALDAFKPGGRRPHPLTEDDSSLDRETGMEIICPPLPLEEVVAEGGYIHRLMDIQKEAGTDKDPAVNHGLHINVNMHEWSPEEKLAVQYLCNRFRSTGVKLGRRATGFGNYIPVFTMARMPGGTISIKTWPGDKHAAAHIRRPTGVSAPGGIDGTVIEVRLAKSTLDMDNLRVMVDYIYALRNWVKIAPRHTVACCFLDRLLMKDVKEYGLLESMFTYWCKKNAPTVYALTSEFGEQQAKPNRLSIMQSAVKEQGIANHKLNQIGIHNDKSTAGSQQAVRISTVLSKGIAVQGELDYDGLVFASTIRPLS